MQHTRLKLVNLSFFFVSPLVEIATNRLHNEVYKFFFSYNPVRDCSNGQTLLFIRMASDYFSISKETVTQKKRF